jgi:hypothetical protein
MKHLLSGVALAAVLAIAAPVWAQSSTTSSTPSAPPSAAAPSTTAPSAQAPAASERATAATPANPSTATARPRRHAQRMHASPPHRLHARYGRHWHRYGWGASSDHMANRLNAQELGRIGGYGGGAFPAHDSPN